MSRHESHALDNALANMQAAPVQAAPAPERPAAAPKPQAAQPKGLRKPRQPKLLVQRRGASVLLVAKNSVTAGRLARAAGLAAGLEVPSVLVPQARAVEMIAQVLLGE